jgi:hypothetical protein
VCLLKAFRIAFDASSRHCRRGTDPPLRQETRAARRLPHRAERLYPPPQDRTTRSSPPTAAKAPAPVVVSIFQRGVTLLEWTPRYATKYIAMQLTPKPPSIVFRSFLRLSIRFANAGRDGSDLPDLENGGRLAVLIGTDAN